jgi:hypothetical protein
VTSRENVLHGASIDFYVEDSVPTIASAQARSDRLHGQGDGTMRPYITATGMAFGLLVIWTALVQFML